MEYIFTHVFAISGYFPDTLMRRIKIWWKGWTHTLSFVWFSYIKGTRFLLLSYFWLYQIKAVKKAGLNVLFYYGVLLKCLHAGQAMHYVYDLFMKGLSLTKPVMVNSAAVADNFVNTGHLYNLCSVIKI